MSDEKPQLHPAEHRAYRELYATSRQLTRRWGRLAGRSRGPPIADALEGGADEAAKLLDDAWPAHRRIRPARRPRRRRASAPGSRDVRTAVVDRGADTGMVVRFAVLDVEHLTTLLRQLAELARARQDRDLAGFCEEWAGRFESELHAVREAAVELGTDPDRVGGAAR